MRYFIISLFLILKLFPAYSQYYTSGSDPARLQWRQIKTPTVRLVFEKNFEKEALRLAAFIDSMAPFISSGLKHHPQRINILIHNQTGYSNGFVSWAPRRSELYSTPHQNINSIDWLEHLSIHEYRHVVQINKLNQGFTRFASILMGEQATGAVLGMYMPMWFLEGDAIITETSLTKSGRGRSFEFNQELKAQLVERGVYSYDKAYMGSYRNQVPNYYKMGYPFAAMVRAAHGPEIWENTVNKTGNSLWIPNPFNRSLKQQLNSGTKHLYQNVFNNLRNQWIEESNLTKTTAFNPVVEVEYDYANFKHSVAINDSILISELEGPGIRSQIVKINISNGSVKPLVFTGIREAEPISGNNQFIVWSELKYHHRWENESYSIIRSYNLETGKTKNITRKTRLFAPAIHPEKPLIAAVEATTDYQFYMVIIDLQTGKTLHRIPSPENRFILTPSWNQDGNNLITVLLERAGKSIYTLNPETGHWAMIKPASFDELRHPVQNGNNVWYSAKGDVSEEIFHLDTGTNQITRLTSSKFGAAHPTITPKTKQLIYSHYTDNGYRPVVYKPTEGLPDTAQLQSSVVNRLADKITLQEQHEPTTQSSYQPYNVEKYSKLNLLGLHSWGPVFSNFEEAGNYTVLGLMSQNLLGTAIITAGYNADPAYSTEKYQIKLSYRAFYPIIDVEFNTGDSRYSQAGIYASATDTFGININEKLKHYYLKTGMRFPFDFSSGNYIRRFETGFKHIYQLRTGFDYTKTYYTRVNNRLVPTGVTSSETFNSLDFRNMEYSVFLYNIRRGTSRDVSTRMGQLMQVVYRHTPWGTYKAGSVFGIHTKLYFPGIGKHHAISIDNDWQNIINGNPIKSQTGNYYRYYRLNNVFRYPRGYSDIYFDQLYAFRLNYMMPIWNPDLALSGLAYVKRLRLNLFHDEANVSYKLTNRNNNITETNKYTPTSTGFELYADTHFFRFILPFSIGYRMGYRNMDKTIFHDFILSTSFSGFLVNEK